MVQRSVEHLRRHQRSRSIRKRMLRTELHAGPSVRTNSPPTPSIPPQPKHRQTSHIPPVPTGLVKPKPNPLIHLSPLHPRRPELNTYTSHTLHQHLSSHAPHLSLLSWILILSLMSVMNPPTALCNLSVRTMVKLMYFGCVCFRGELGYWIVMIYACVSWISSLSSSSWFLIPLCRPAIWCDLSRITAVSLCGVWSHVVVLGMSARLYWYPMWMRRLATRVLLFVWMWVCWDSVRVTEMLVWWTAEIWLGWVQGMSMWGLQLLCLGKLTC